MDEDPRATRRRTRRRYETPGEARFLTFSCYQRLPLFGNDAIKRAFAEHLIKTRKATHFRLYAWVVMPEHVHLVLEPSLPDYPVSFVLTQIKSHFAARVLRRWRKLDAGVLPRLVDRNGKHRFWQIGGGYDRNLTLSGEFEEKVNYVHENPVRRGLVGRAVDWPWSSAQWYAHREGVTMDEVV
ncbi:MAG: transposase [Phycisphaeraceae bacterium]